jgi:hypothetical protein
MKQSHLYFVAALLFAVAAGLNVFNQGLNLIAGIGVVGAGALAGLGIASRRAGR